jgi:hypothetical protein
MILKEAILKTMSELKRSATSNEIGNYLIEKKYWVPTGTTPFSTISAILSTFVLKGDSRVKRVKEDNVYLYYLTKNEQYMFQKSTIEKPTDKKVAKEITYTERDLHILLSTYLNSVTIFSKTIFHEKSNGKDETQKWTHPDMIGIQFLKLQPEAQKLLKVSNQTETFKLYSYELKKEIKTDYDLKQKYFQAVSNSSWANYGYLVTMEINDILLDEIERLNQSFGIGVIKLHSDPFQSKILFPSKRKNIDFKTVDKLCRLNNDFKKFIEQIEKLLTSEDKYSKLIERELSEYCDKYFENDSEIEEYCKKMNISVGSDEEILRIISQTKQPQNTEEIISATLKLKTNNTKENRFNFFDKGLKKGDIITFIENSKYTAIVEDYNTVLFEGQIFKLSTIVKILKRRIGSHTKSEAYQGSLYFTFNGKKLSDL